MRIKKTKKNYEVIAKKLASLNGSAESYYLLGVVDSECRNNKENGKLKNVWNSVEDNAPPEGRLLLGIDSKSNVYSFIARRLGNGVTMYFGGDLNPCADPLQWRELPRKG